MVADVEIDTADRPRRPLFGDEFFSYPVNDDFHFNYHPMDSGAFRRAPNLSAFGFVV